MAAETKEGKTPGFSLSRKIPYNCGVRFPLAVPTSDFFKSGRFRSVWRGCLTFAALAASACSVQQPETDKRPPEMEGGSVDAFEQIIDPDMASISGYVYYCDSVREGEILVFALKSPIVPNAFLDQAQGQVYAADKVSSRGEACYRPYKIFNIPDGKTYLFAVIDEGEVREEFQIDDEGTRVGVWEDPTGEPDGKPDPIAVRVRDRKEYNGRHINMNYPPRVVFGMKKEKLPRSMVKFNPPRLTGKPFNRLPGAHPKFKEGAVAFRDVSASSGIAGGNGSRPPDGTGGGAGFCDLDGDGWEDAILPEAEPLNGPPLRFAQGGGVAAYRNNGDGTFVRFSDGIGLNARINLTGVSCADVDNDGDTDLFFGGIGRSLFLINRNGVFQDETKARGLEDPEFVTFGSFADVDGDLDLDLYLTHYTNIHFTEDKERDFPEDFPGVPNRLLLNDGKGFFSPSPFSEIVAGGEKSYMSVFSDFNLDGRQDLFVANDADFNSLYHNGEDGEFFDMSLISGAAYRMSGMGVTSGDYDNDGDFDIYVTNAQNTPNTLYRNGGGGFFDNITLEAGFFTDETMLVGWGTQFFDFDNDGDLDIFVANGPLSDELSRPEDKDGMIHLLYANNGDGTYSNVQRLVDQGPEKRNTGGAAFADYDRDGDVDVLLNNLGAPATLLRNEVGSRLNWLQVELVGKQSGRNAIGALIKVRTGRLTQVREARIHESFMSSNSPVVHFGLGKLGLAEEATVQWPSGRVGRIKNVEANQRIQVFER